MNKTTNGLKAADEDKIQQNADLHAYNLNMYQITLFSKQNTLGTVGGPGGRDQTLAVKKRKNAKKSFFFRKKSKLPKKVYFFLHISSSYAKYWGKQIFTHGSFPRKRKK